MDDPDVIEPDYEVKQDLEKIQRNIRFKYI